MTEGRSYCAHGAQQAISPLLKLHWYCKDVNRDGLPGDPGAGPGIRFPKQHVRDYGDLPLVHCRNNVFEQGYRLAMGLFPKQQRDKSEWNARIWWLAMLATNIGCWLLARVARRHAESWHFETEANATCRGILVQIPIPNIRIPI